MTWKGKFSPWMSTSKWKDKKKSDKKVIVKSEVEVKKGGPMSD